MKNLMKYAALLAAVLFMGCTFASCGDDDDDEPTPSVTAPEGVEAIDLGLTSGTKWANRNIGAEKATDYGDYFAWGETVPYGKEDKSNLTNFSYNASDNYTKSVFSLSTYKWRTGTTWTKYCTVDNKEELDLEDDAAYVNWGSKWRMPSNDQMQELIDECTWTWETISGVKGYRVTSKKNSNSIFLPAAGYRYNSSLDYAGSYGYYWSCTLDSGSPDLAHYLDLGSYHHDIDGGNRYYGRSVRPVQAN